MKNKLKKEISKLKYHNYKLFMQCENNKNTAFFYKQIVDNLLTGEYSTNPKMTYYKIFKKRINLIEKVDNTYLYTNKYYDSTFLIRTPNTRIDFTKEYNYINIELIDAFTSTKIGSADFNVNKIYSFESTDYPKKAKLIGLDIFNDSFQFNGLGTILLQSSFEYLYSQNIEIITTDPLSNNINILQHFYTKNGMKNYYINLFDYFKDN